MPELPEVETICRQLNSSLKGRVVKKIEVLREKSFQGDPDNLVGWEIDKVGRKSKVIEIFFKERNEMVICHLKMTGQLIFLDRGKRIVGGHPTADWVRDLPSKHTRVMWEFEDGSKLFFNDMRVFGWMKIVDKGEYEEITAKKVPDVIDESFSIEYFQSLIAKTSKAIKLLILDQDKLGGMGNIYANDALYLAKIDPTRKANSLSSDEVSSLWGAMREVINKGIKYGGASAANYVDTQGLGGTYQDYFLVYKKDGKPCLICGAKIEKRKIGGRGTFYCPNCQR